MKDDCMYFRNTNITRKWGYRIGWGGGGGSSWELKRNSWWDVLACGVMVAWTTIHYREVADVGIIGVVFKEFTLRRWDGNYLKKELE